MRVKPKQYLVIGLGRFGESVARTLCALGHEVMAVDESQELVDAVAPYVTQAVQADATDEAALSSIGIHNFDAAIVSVGQNERNSILIAVLCKEKGVPYVVAKAIDDLHAKILTKVGVDRVVFPEREMGQRLAKSLAKPGIVELMELDRDHQIVEINLPARWQDRTLAQINVRRSYGISVLAIHRQSEFVVSPGADVQFRAGDNLLVLGRQADIAALDQK